MIEFLGTPLLKTISPDEKEINLSIMCGVSEARAEVFVDALMAAKQSSFSSEERMLVPGMPPVVGQHFNLGLLIQNLQIDTETLPEIMLLGLLIGRIYTEMEARSAEAEKRVNKMVALLQKDPAKALRKMQKELLKAVKSSK